MCKNTTNVSQQTRFALKIPFHNLLCAPGTMTVAYIYSHVCTKYKYRFYLPFVSLWEDVTSSPPAVRQCRYSQQNKVGVFFESRCVKLVRKSSLIAADPPKVEMNLSETRESEVTAAEHPGRIKMMWRLSSEEFVMNGSGDLPLLTLCSLDDQTGRWWSLPLL